MEAPKPISLLTPESNITFTDKKEFKLAYEKTEFLIEIGKLTSEKLGIKLKENSSSTNIYYSNSFNLEELQIIHRSFRYFDNINEAVSYIQDIFEEKKVNLKMENDTLCLILKINKIGKGEDLISIELKKNNLSLQEINENLSKEVSYLKNKSEILEKENNNNKNEINILKNDIYNLNIKINELLNWKNEMKEKEKKKNTFTFDSKIITKKEELNLITNRLKNIDYFRNKEISYELVFRGTRDGGTPEIFHQKCDGTSKTITIIKTIKGLKFGGYIEKKWNSFSQWINDDENCFIFSIDLKKIYNPVKGEGKYYFAKSFGPNFSEFGLQFDLFKKSTLNLYTKETANKYFKYFDRDYEINGGEKEFQAEEVEVFKII